MHYRIILHRAWRHGRALIHPGTYRVPEDMRPELGELAITQAGATKVQPKRVEPLDDQSADDKSKTEARSNAPAPHNKARGKAPDNKASLGE